MTDSLRDRVIAMADDHTRRHGPVRQHELARAVAALAVAHEREACAQAAERMAPAIPDEDWADDYKAGYLDAARQCAAAIRARGDTL